MMFVTIACGSISGWHSIVSSSGTARQLENELDARPVGGGVMFVEMMLAIFALIIAGTIAPAEYKAAHRQRSRSYLCRGRIEIPGSHRDFRQTMAGLTAA